ncbi:MAG TPA: (Fe-S)-binding protein, partial [Rubrobacter sp.]|nr:(Fe-S)-binding protein [Rubrobacter sp.]
FKEMPEENRSESLGHRVREFSDFLVNVLGVKDLGAHYEGRAVFHCGCHQRRELGVLEEPRELLRSVAGLELLDWENEELCCGFGGTFAVKMPDVSTAMADEKIQALLKSGADTLVSGDSSCLMHLSGRLKREGHGARVLHLAQILDSGDGKVGKRCTQRDRPGSVMPTTGARKALRAKSRVSTNGAGGRSRIGTSTTPWLWQRRSS